MADGTGLQVESDLLGAEANPADSVLGQALEVIRLDLPCTDVERFFAVDSATWTRFLSKQNGFLEKKQLFAPFTSSLSSHMPNCSVYTT